MTNPVTSTSVAAQGGGVGRGLQRNEPAAVGEAGGERVGGGDGAGQRGLADAGTAKDERGGAGGKQGIGEGGDLGVAAETAIGGVDADLHVLDARIVRSCTF